MSLINSLNIGRSALTVNQAALQVTGNNIANAGNTDYTRQTANVAPAEDSKYGSFMLGNGVDLLSVQRQIDEALQGRLRASVSDSSGAATTQQFLDRVQSVFNELGDQDLSTHLSTFFNAWSTLSNSPQDQSQRQIVLNEGRSLAGWFQSMRTDLGGIQDDVQTQLQSLTKDANGLAQQVADLNGQIAVAEGGGSATANALRDQRDAVLKKLAGDIGITTTQGANGAINVYLGSEPVVLGNQNRGLTAVQGTTNGQTTISLQIKATGGNATASGGQIGALMDLQNGTIQQTVDQLDSLAGNLIFELNKVYSQGQGLQGYTSVTASNAVSDPTASLSQAGLAFAPKTGSFVVQVLDKSTNTPVNTLVTVNQDGTGSDTTLNSLKSSLSSITGVSATISNGKLSISGSSPNYEISFSQDSSNTLAALGINSFFTGTDASNIALNGQVAANPSLLAASMNGDPLDNRTALAIAGLQSKALAGLSGQTLTDAYSNMINQTSVSAATAKNNADAASTVQQTLEAQRESLSGVDMNEEAVNLIKQQRAFQGAAKLVTAIDDMMKTVLSLVG